MKALISGVYSARRALLVGGAAALVLAFTVAQQPLLAKPRPPRPVPTDIQVPAGHKEFLDGRAYGTQNYSCLPSATAPSGFAWTLFTPQANLFDDQSRQIITHFLSPNPDEGGTPRATWQHSRDTSMVWAMAVATSSDPAYVAPGAIPWLKLQIVGTSDGPTGGDRLTRTTFIQRIGTVGGVAPSTGCAVSTDIGKRVFVPYQADYVFYRDQNADFDQEN